jgi:hypothetical protein
MGGHLVACAPIDLEPIHQAFVDGGSTDSSHESAVDAPSDAQAEGPGAPCKRGIAATAGPSANFAPTAASPGISWWYNWDTQSAGGDPRIEYVPMIWGGGSLNATIPVGSKYLLGFNEPNFKSQANLTVQEAVADWPAVEALAHPAGLPIVSPGVNFCGSPSNPSGCTDPAITDPYTYIKDFLAACTGCKVDYIAVHAYVCDLPLLRAYLEGNLQTGGTMQGFLQFQRPIWLTEFACDSSHSVADQKAYMEAAVPYLESNTHVARYGWFSAKPIPNALLTNADGSLTDLGTTYVALPQTCQ